MSEQEIVDEALERVSNWETGMGEFFGLFDEWASDYRVIDKTKNPAPTGISRNITGEATRAVHALASTMTKMQTGMDPFFELRSDGATEEALFVEEQRYQKMIQQLEFKRNLYRGNKGLFLFGTQVWEEPYVSFPANTPTPMYEGTDFKPLSLLQCAFETSVYDMKLSDFFAVINRMGSNYLRFMANSGNGVWNQELVEQGIKEKQSAGVSGYSDSAIEKRRSAAKYNHTQESQNELIIWHGRLSNLENPTLLEMWQKFGRTDDIRFSDITVGILNRRHLVRLHPTPYGTWHHMFKIGHNEEFELEPIAYGTGKFGHNIQKDMNRMMRYVSDVGKMSLWNMRLAGRGAGLKSQNMAMFPLAVIQVDDVNQILPHKPEMDGMRWGLEIMKQLIEDYRGTTGATNTLQAVVTGATAAETTLAQGEALRGLSLKAEINCDMVIKPHLQVMHKNFIDQNPYDTKVIRDLDFIVKSVTDKDFRPEQSKKLLEFLQFATSIRQAMPLDFNPMPIIKYFARSVGINPRELKEPRPEIDRMLDVLQRTNANTELKTAMIGEMEGLQNQNPTVSGVPSPAGRPAVPAAMGVI